MGNIYESPDKGKTIYKRETGQSFKSKVLVKKGDNMSDWLDGTKPKKIEARYSAYLSWDLDDYDIDWDDIEDYEVWRGDLEITFKDGTKRVIDSFQELSVDTKHGLEEVLILDEDWNQVEGLN